MAELCDIKKIKEDSIEQAKEVFVGNATQIRINPNNVWIPYNNRRKDVVYNIAVSNSNRVANWAAKKFGEEFSKGWTEISQGFSDGIKVLFKFPKNLEEAYINNNNARLYADLVRSKEQEVLQELYANREAYISEAQRLFQEGDNSLDVEITNLFYNVNSPDAKRRQRNPKLDRLVLKTVAAMGVTVKDMEEYKREYEARTGKELTQLGVADITNNILAYSEDDGVTLTEEAMHFLVFANWTSPEIQAIRNAKLSNGERALIKSDVWAKNVDIYTQVYNGDMEKVEKEIIGKLIAEYMYDKYDSENVSVRSVLNDLIKRFLAILRISIKGNSALDRGNYSKELRDALDIVVDNIEVGKYDIPFSTTETIEPVIAKESYFQNVIQETINNLENRIIGLEERMVGLVGEDLQRFNDLMTKLGVKYPDMKAMNDSLEKLKNSTTPLTPDEQQELEDITEVIKLNAADAIDKSNVKRIERVRARIVELNKELQAKRFHAGLHLFILGADGKSGIRKDIEQIVDYIKRIQKGEINVYPESYNNIVELLDIYSPIVKTLNEGFFNKMNLNELTPEENKKLKAEVNSLSIVINGIYTNLKAMAGEVASQHNLQYKHLNPDIDTNKKTFLNSSFSNLWLGSLKNVKEDWGRLFHFEVNKIKNKISEIVNLKGVDLLNELGEAGKNVNMKLLKEVDDNGDPTHYFISEVKTGLFVKNEEKARLEAIKKTEEFAKSKLGKDYNIPKDPSEFYKFFNGNLLTGLDTTLLNDEMKNRSLMLKVFNREMAIWNDANTKVRPDAQNIIEDRRKNMTKTQFNKWYNANIYEIENEYGQTEYRFKGELVMPSTGEVKEREYKGTKYTTNTFDYTNPDYKRLQASNPEAFRTLSILKRVLSEHKNYLHTKTYSWEREQRLPQISKSGFDVVTGGLKGGRELISEQLSSRMDDDYYGDKLNGTLLRRPPIRYIGLLNDPKLITDDLVRSTMQFVEMSTHYREYTRELPKLHGMIDAVNLGTVVDRSIISGKQTIIDGSQSNLSKRMQTLMETIVYGESGNSNLTVFLGNKEIDLNKVSEKLVKYIRNVNLQGNIPSILVGFLSGQVAAVEEAFLGKFYSKKDFFESKQEFAKSYLELLSDFEKPVKTSKIGVIAQYLDLVDGNTKSFSNLDKNRGLRVATQLTNYGGWRMADMALKGQGLIAVSKGIRLINGEWYTKSSFKGSKEDWDKGERLWDKLSVENGKIKYDSSVTNDVIELWKIRVSEINSRLDTQITDLDKGLAHKHALFRFATIHMGWLYQGLGRGFKPRGFDYSTQSIEEGYWITAGKLFLTPSQLVNLVKDWDRLKPVERENIQRLIAMMTTSGIIFALAYIINAIALDDDDEDDPFFRYMVYVLTRMLTESSARVSLGETMNYIQRPVSGLEKINNFSAPVDMIMNLFNDSDEIEKGFYAGYSKSEQNLIKSIPLLRGLFENVYGGYINEIVGKGEPSIAVALREKNKYMVNNVINKEGWLMQLPYGLLTKMMGWLVGRPIAEAYSSQPKSESIYQLPTKKANK